MRVSAGHVASGVAVAAVAIATPAIAGRGPITADARPAGPAVRIASASGVTIMRFDQSTTALVLHAGSVDPGGRGWRFGPSVGPAERRRLVAAFNGGFRLSSGGQGFFAYGRTAVALKRGLASIVTYADGRTDVGSWGREVPAHGARVVSVRQNMGLLVDRGRPTAAALSCGPACWGATLGGGTVVARSAIGVDGAGRLFYGGGRALTPDQLARGLARVGVVRAAELDINPEWVAAYRYRRSGGGLRAVAVIPAQSGVPGAFLAPYSRDFFTVVSR
jgi:hypothetical protein